MINIELDFNRDIQVFVSNKDISVRRIGDVVLLEKNTDRLIARPPWENLLVANNYKVTSGNRIKFPRTRTESNIVLKSKEYDLSRIVDITYNREFIVALLQNDKLYICNYCKIDGSEIDEKGITIEISSKKSELINEK